MVAFVSQDGDKPASSILAYLKRVVLSLLKRKSFETGVRLYALPYTSERIHITMHHKYMQRG